MTEELDPKILAQQLRKPEGKLGLEVAERMNQSNRGICLNTYDFLDLSKNQHVVEIGMGNGYFVETLFAKEDSLQYSGVDYSQTMVSKASEINHKLCESGKVRLIHASIDRIPLDNESADWICTTNTIYFWPDVHNNLLELKRILKPKGKLIIAYRDKTFMTSLKVTKHGFNKYNQSEVENMLSKAGFTMVRSVIKHEAPIFHEGQEIILEGVFTIGTKS